MLEIYCPYFKNKYQPVECPAISYPLNSEDEKNWNMYKVYTFSLYGIESKVGCVFPMVIWSGFCSMGQYKDDHWEDAPHFSSKPLF